MPFAGFASFLKRFMPWGGFVGQEKPSESLAFYLADCWDYRLKQLDLD